jgi:hypothetical protein
MNIFNSNMFQTLVKHLSGGKKLDTSLLEIINESFTQENKCYF